MCGFSFLGVDFFFLVRDFARLQVLQNFVCSLFCAYSKINRYVNRKLMRKKKELTKAEKMRECRQRKKKEIFYVNKNLNFSKGRYKVNKILLSNNLCNLKSVKNYISIVHKVHWHVHPKQHAYVSKEAETCLSLFLSLICISFRTTKSGTTVDPVFSRFIRILHQKLMCHTTFNGKQLLQ